MMSLACKESANRAVRRSSGRFRTGACALRTPRSDHAATTTSIRRSGRAEHGDGSGSAPSSKPTSYRALSPRASPLARFTTIRIDSLSNTAMAGARPIGPMQSKFHRSPHVLPASRPVVRRHSIVLIRAPISPMERESKAKLDLSQFALSMSESARAATPTSFRWALPGPFRQPCHWRQRPCPESRSGSANFQIFLPIAASGVHRGFRRRRFDLVPRRGARALRARANGSLRIRRGQVCGCRLSPLFSL